MSDLQDITRLPSDFAGQVRLFPLPELVVFPHAMQPLHIFEPRYCEMLVSALQSDRLIAMATLATGMTSFLTARPALEPIVCICKIVSHAELENGTHNVLLVGAKRATLVREIESGLAFRTAEIEVKPDVDFTNDAQKRLLLRASLLDAFAEVIPKSANIQQNLHDLMAGQMGLGPITDIISFTLGMSSEVKLKLLAEANVDRRASLLIRVLKSMASGEAPGNPRSGSRGNRDFPPPFSVN